MDLAGIRVITNNLDSLRKIEEELFNLIMKEGMHIVAIPCLPNIQQYDDSFYQIHPGALMECQPRTWIETNSQNYEYNHWVEKCKDDGYRGVHFVFGKHIIVDNAARAIHVICEVQLRTIRQHSWANEHHALLYKKEIPETQIIDKMKELSNKLYDADMTSEKLREEIANIKR